MKKRKHLNDVIREALKIKPKVIIGLSISFFVFALLQLYWQYQTQQDSFVASTQELEKRFLIEEQSTETLLKALSHYYSSQSIKSTQEFNNFAKSLIPQHAFINAIGVSQLYSTPSPEAPNIAKNQLLFKESLANHHFPKLPITSIIPDEELHRMYIGEDLFSLQTLKKEFFKLAAIDATGIYWLNSKLTEQPVIMLNQPIYHRRVTGLSSDEKTQHLMGSIFLLFDIAPFIVQATQPLFPYLETLKLKINRNVLPIETTLYQNQESQTHVDNYLNAKLIALMRNFDFQDRIQISTMRPHIQLEIKSNWHISSIDFISLILFGAVGAVLFLLIDLATKIFSGYTQTLLKTQSRLAEILYTSHDAVIITNKNGIVESWNPRCEEVFGYQAEEMLGQSLIELFTKLSENNLQDPVEQKLLNLFSGQALSQGSQNMHGKLLELYLLNRYQQRILIEITYSILSVNDSKEISLFIQDITHQRKTESEIKKLAYYDPLTNLENRVLFQQNFERLLQTPTPPKFSVYFIDLDGFKKVNDTLGHGIGDELLKVIAQRIVHTIEGTHCPYHICRFGGDEFIIMLENNDSNLTQDILKRLLLKIQRVIRIKQNELQVSASIGVAFYPEHGEDMDTLMRHADTAMYESKNRGKNTYSIYKTEMTEHLSRRLLLEKHLRLALDYNEFTLVFQPQMNLESGDIIGVEALIRWKNRTLGFISPDQFIPIAEESNLIIEIGDWVVDTCIQQLILWQETELANLHIAINVSSVQFNKPGFIEGVYKKMGRAGLASRLIEIELTERTVMDNADENIELFNDIRQQGFGLSVDDFGTGYSSLSYLKRFPLSILKIDKSFVDGLPTDDDDISIANAILNLAHSLNIKVVAEGVETLEQLQFLKAANCNYAQGYFISRPMPAADLENWLATHTKNFYESKQYQALLTNSQRQQTDISS